MKLVSWSMVALVAGLSACASAGRDNPNPNPDGTVATPIDGPLGHIDGPPPIDAPPPIDGPPACTPTPSQLLTNPAFDMNPMSVGWIEMPIDAAFPIVTPDDGVTEKSAPNKAWMGGVAQANANDALYQDVTIPPNTTHLDVSGFYQVRSAENALFVYDTSTIDLWDSSGTVLDSVLALDNTMPTTGWKAFHHTFGADLSGQTVRLRLASASDDTNATSFYFDSLTLTATQCQ